MAPPTGKGARIPRSGSSKGLLRSGSKAAIAVSGHSFGSAGSASSLHSSRSAGSLLPTSRSADDLRYFTLGRGGNGFGGGGGGGGGGGSSGALGGLLRAVCPTGAMRMLLPVLIASLLSSLVTYYIILSHSGYTQTEVVPLITASRAGDRIDLRMGIQLQEHPLDAAAAVAFAHLPRNHEMRRQQAQQAQAAAAKQAAASAGGGGGGARGGQAQQQQQQQQQQAAAVQQKQQQPKQKQQAAQQQQQQQQQAQKQQQAASGGGGGRQQDAKQRSAASGASGAAAARPPQQHASPQTVHSIHAEQVRLAAIINKQHLFGVEGGDKAAKAAAPRGPPRFGTGGPGSLRLALVNHAPYHLEIVAGLLHIFRDYRCEMRYYQAGQQSADGNYTAQQLLEQSGFLQLLGGLPAGLLHPTNATPAPADFVIFVSPEYFIPETKAFLAALRPQSALMLVHNGNNPNVQRLQPLHPHLHFAALAPHVAAHSRQHLHVHTHWLLAVLPFKPVNPCVLSANSPLCLHGFSIQGNFEPQRRNYTRMWQMLEVHKRSGSLNNLGVGKPMHVHLLGRGSTKALGVPRDVSDMTTVHAYLQFSAYYEQIHHTHALVLLLGSDMYLQYKMSSTLVCSLMTGVPVIADNATLGAYTYLHPEHVFVQGRGQDEVDVMLQVLAMAPEEVQKKREAVSALAEHLNLRTLLLIKTFMPPHKT